jgi:hypothetical protein
MPQTLCLMNAWSIPENRQVAIHRNISKVA